MPFAAKTSEKRTCPVPVSHARESSAARLRHSARTIQEAPFAGGAELFEQRERPMSTYRGTDRRNGKSWASRLGQKGEDFRVRAPFLVSGDPPISVPRPKPDSDPLSARRQTSRVFSAETTERPCRLTTDSLGRAKCRAKKSAASCVRDRKARTWRRDTLAEHAGPIRNPPCRKTTKRISYRYITEKPSHRKERLRKHGRPTRYSALT